jgi:hypothetical protein
MWRSARSTAGVRGERAGALFASPFLHRPQRPIVANTSEGRLASILRTHGSATPRTPLGSKTARQLIPGVASVFEELVDGLKVGLRCSKIRRKLEQDGSEFFF